MNKYIDAEKLITEIERWSDGKLALSLLTEIKGIIAALQQEQLDENEAIEKNRIDAALIGFHLACGNGDKTIGECIEFWKPIIVDSLKQEQPEVDLVAELEHRLATTPNEQLEKEWKELEPWNNIGPTVQEFLYGKQPEVDLNEEIDRFLKSEESTTYENAGSYKVAVKDLKKIARHFYGLRNRALEEAAWHVYESWMGGTMDDVRRDMVELGKVLNARKEENK